MRVGFYGKLADAIAPEVEVDMAGACSIADLRTRLAGLYPHATSDIAGPRSRACVAGQLVHDSFLVQPGQDVEILAPLSGG